MTGFCGPIRHSQHELLERDRNASKFLKKKKKGKEISKFFKKNRTRNIRIHFVFLYS